MWIKRNRNYQVYKNGINSFHSELDCIGIINSIRRFDAFIESMTDSKDDNSLNRSQTKPIKLWPPILENSKVQSKIKIERKIFN